jgi:hypothetical protein
LLTGMCTGAARPYRRRRIARSARHDHGKAPDELAELDPTNEVVRGPERFVDDGEVTASAEVSAGIDMALHRWHA